MRIKQKGFSLIELLIVVAIILIIAAIAIPNLLRSKMAANEASAVATLRTINTAEVVYSSTYSVPGVFAVSLNALGDGGTAASCSPATLATTPPTSANACLIDGALEIAGVAPGKSGYLVSYANPVGGYSVNNDPVSVGSTGTRQFYTDQSLVIRQNTGAAASATSKPI
jgi:prepilin-type N-terminal cleavage/methylation domain-containing protein